MNNTLDEVIAVVRQLHDGQVRKYTGAPYSEHPIEVCAYVQQVTDDHDVHIAALLHDVLEDTDTSVDFIKSNFGNRVAEMVIALTDVKNPSLNRKTRKAMDVERLCSASPDVQIIKMFDLISNLSTIAQHDRTFACLYLEEKFNLLKAFGQRIPDELPWCIAFNSAVRCWCMSADSVSFHKLHKPLTKEKIKQYREILYGIQKKLPTDKVL